MEDEEEEVLCYLDRVLEEEEEESEYGDGELEPITTTHRQFKVRHELERSWMQRKKRVQTHIQTHTRTYTCVHTFAILPFKMENPSQCIGGVTCASSQSHLCCKSVCVCVRV